MPIRRYLIFTWIFLSCLELPSRALFVSPKGNDSNSGISLAEAFSSLQKASDVSLPGDTIFVDSGNYSSKEKSVLKIRRSGTANNWIIYKNLGIERPVVLVTGEAGIVVESASYLSIEGFDIMMDLHHFEKQAHEAMPDHLTSKGNGILVERVANRNKLSHHLKIYNNFIHNCPGTGIVVNHSDYLTISYNQIHDNGELSLTNNAGIRIQFLVEFDNQEGYHNFINANTIYNHRRYSRLEKEIESCEKTHSGSGISISDNRYGTGVQGLQGYQMQSLVSNNIIYNNGGVAIDLYESNKVDVLNNTCFRNNRNKQVNCGEIFVRNVKNSRIANNIFYANQGKLGNKISNIENLNLNHNLYFNSSGFDQGTNDLVADPMFVRANNNETFLDFNLRPKSPAINAGSNAQITAYDFLGSNRLLGTQVDLGAFEYTGPKVKPRDFVPARVDERSMKLYWQSAYHEKTGQIIVNNTRGRVFSCRIYDCRGKLVTESVASEDSLLGLEFDVSTFPKGIYFVIAFSDKETLFNKIHISN
ncbi:MAG: right-handed parallel beta-helix repeat-containing protein [Saprospiraceae bacterium]|nr:right-handed parallel beta-helix repeat-containing protein [Candidatus Vicinibacter affinis]